MADDTNQTTADEEGIEGQGQLPYTPNMPAALEPDQEWTRYAEQAIRGLYPRLMPGLDYVWGRPADDPEGDPRILAWNDKLGPEPDMAKVQEAAQKIVDDAAPKAMPLAQQPVSEQAEAERFRQQREGQ